MASASREARIAIAALAALVACGCQPRLRAPVRAAKATPAVREDSAVVKPQQDAHVGVAIVVFDGTDVSRYLGGWGVRPTIPEIAVEPGSHTFEVAYYDFDTRTTSQGTATLQFFAHPGHLYVIHAGARGIFSKLGLTLVRARNPSWRAWVEDEGLAAR